VTRRTLALLFVVVGAGLFSLGWWLIWPPLGLITAGALVVWAGFYLVDVGGLIESRTAPPRYPPV
jgi:hypothetical protein